MIAADYALFEFLNGTIHSPLFDQIMPVITKSSNVTNGTIALLVTYLAVQRKKEALIIVIGALLAYAVADTLAYRVLKPFFGRIRPSSDAYMLDGVSHFLDSTRYLIGYKGSFSTPSNHATNMFVMGIYFSLFYPKWTKILLPLAIFISYTRIYVGVHYPFDIFLGAVLGSAVAIAFYLGVKRIPIIARLDAE